MILLELLLFALIIGALADVITGDGRIKHLDKITWVLVIIFLPLIGSILWFLIGHDYQAGHTEHVSLGDAGRAPAPASKTEWEIAELDREIRAHEKAERIARLEAELKAKREAKGGA